MGKVRLPGRPHAVTDRTSRVLGYQNGQLGMVGQPIVLEPGGAEVGEARFDHLNTLKMLEL